MKNKPYLLIYTENCALTIKSFKSLSAAKRFATKFTKANPPKEYGDNWLEMIIEGKIVKQYEGFIHWRQT